MYCVCNFWKLLYYQHVSDYVYIFCQKSPGVLSLLFRFFVFLLGSYL
jgi:hypothetical protein